MPHWILTAVDHRSEIWKVYPIQRIVVEAPDEREARQKVAAAAPRFPQSNPWLDPALTSCESPRAGSAGSVERSGRKSPGRSRGELR
jgi:hypothetical protein